MNFNNNGWEIKRNAPMDPKSKKKIKNITIAAVILTVIIVVISSSYYLVNDKQQAVVTTFGKFTGITEAGIHFKIPFIQYAELVDVNVSLKEEIGYRTYPDGSTPRVPNESKMITGDLNIVNVDFFVEYRISDPYKFLYHSENPRDILKNITQSSIRNIISSYEVDDILTTKKGEIQTKIKDLIDIELITYDIGLMLTGIKIQDAEPPTPEVIAAFKSVETAKQDRQTAINQAKAYENANIPRAQAEADQLIQNAEFLKQDRINDAKKQVAMFDAMFNQYKLNPEINRQRMYYEMIEQVLPGVKVYINAGENNNVSMILPLEDFAGSQSGQTN